LTSHGDSSDPRLLIVAFPDNVPAGPVTVGYHILSVDGHVVDDKLSFTINNQPKVATGMIDPLDIVRAVSTLTAATVVGCGVLNWYTRDAHATKGGAIWRTRAAT